ncbi:hypothetical protein IV203_034966 [Nitzschia inconspicua]|uniref:Uncharacterized protein n=1 Tax=Nitzschia inconspicua TaxID=303405 RepID=A0A9K3LE61_9STRA|nr:hypothetical protein IV203_034966 [Nitzschia inconspicua]
MSSSNVNGTTIDNNHSHRSLAQDAAGWYYSNLDPHSTNESNVQRYLRTPVVALTVKAFQHSTKPAPPPVAGQQPQPPNSNNGNDPTEQTKRVSMHDWREYLQTNHSSDNGKDAATERRQLQQQYASLSRRTKARMEAFLAGCSLAVPGPEEGHDSKERKNDDGATDELSALISFQDGLLGFGMVGASPPSTPYRQRSPSFTEKMGRTVMGKSIDPNLSNHPQIDENDLIKRLELYIRTVQRVRNLNEECVIAMEPPKAIRTRAKYTTYAFVATAAYVRNISPVLTRLLHCLTMEMLAVECVAEEITKVIHRIVSEYEHGTSFASLAFLSTPEVNADSLLLPLILKYLNFLQSDWERLVRACELERMLARTFDPKVRKMFKMIEFQSIGHLLEVCHEFRHQLQNIELPPNVCAVAENVNTLCNNPEAVRQALRDLRREVITVNGHVLPPVTSRKALINLLTQTLNSRTLTSAPPKKKRGKHKTKEIPTMQQSLSVPDLTKHHDTDYFSSDPPSSPEKQPHVPPDPLGDAVISDLSADDSPGFDSSSAVDTSPETNGKKQRRQRSQFHLSTIDVLTRRLLIAASRTGNGGDAYFFVKDLFGGEDVEVVPTSTVAFQDRMVRPGTIDILVRLASVTIKCHQSFDVYPKSLVGEVEPLIQFHTTTTESISLREVRAADSTSGEATPDELSEHGEATSSLMVVQEQHTDRTGWRVISIRPAMYEKIEVWNTPS